MRTLLPLLLLSLPAFAQTPPPASVSMDEEGVVLRSADGDFRLQLGALLQADGRFFLGEDADSADNALLLRRVRPIFEGTVFRHYDFRLMPDFGDGEARIQDAYVDAHPSGALRLRAGRFKSPFGLEYLQSDSNLPFAERALPTNLVPNRDVGLQLHGKLQDGLVSYAVGIFDGAVDGASASDDTEDGKDVVARVFAHPLRPLGLSALEHLGLGFAVSYGRTTGPEGLPVYRTASLQPFFRYREGDVTGVEAAGERVRLSPQAYLYVGPVGLLGEYVRASQEVAQAGAPPTRLTHSAWQATGSFVVYGGSAAYDGVEPRTPFRPALGEWGALELALRHAQLHLDDATFPLYADPTSAAQAARASGVALNAYFNAFTRLSLDLERTTFDGGAAGGADRPAELLLLTRAQLSF